MIGHGIVAWAIVGLAAGVIAKFLAGGWDAGGCLGQMMVAGGGALFAGWAWTTIAEHDPTDGTDALAALAGAILMLWVASILVPRQR